MTPKRFTKLLLAAVIFFVSFQESEWDIGKLDTARDVDYLTEVEKNVILEMNKVRTNPELYAKLYVTEIKELYDGKILRYPNEVPIMTQEGISAVNECYRALLKAKPVQILNPSKGMTLAAKDHVSDQSKSGKIGHEGSDRSTSYDRMDRHGEWQITAGENIDYGNKIARRIVLSLLIDDGVKNRGHRINMLKDNFGKTGVAIGTHPRYDHMCVMTYAGDYKEQ